MFLLDYFLYLLSFIFACLFILNGLKVNILLLLIIKYTLIIIKMSIESILLLLKCTIYNNVSKIFKN